MPKMKMRAEGEMMTELKSLEVGGNVGAKNLSPLRWRRKIGITVWASCAGLNIITAIYQMVLGDFWMLLFFCLCFGMCVELLWEATR